MVCEATREARPVGLGLRPWLAAVPGLTGGRGDPRGAGDETWRGARGREAPVALCARTGHT